MTIKRKIIIGLIGFFSILFFVNRHIIIAVYYIGLSYVSTPDFNYVKEKTWSHNGGFKIAEGDFVTFNKGGLFQITNDTIYYKGSPKALVKRLNKNYFLLTVSSIDGKQTGSYTNIEEHLN